MSNEPIKGTLIVELKGPKGAKQTPAYFVTYTNSKGKLMTRTPLAGKAKCFEDQDASDGCAIDIITDNGQLASVTIPGKAAVERVTTVRTGSTPLRGGFGKPAAERTGANVDATAPYNFISAEKPISFELSPEAQRFSGTLTCSLEALTPLLVSGPTSEIEVTAARNERRPIRRTFFAVATRPTIPASSLKGMSRAAMEVLTKAPMDGLVSDRTIGFRDIATADDQTPYSKRFRSGDERLYAGMLKQRGRERSLTPCEFIRFDPEAINIDALKRSFPSAESKYLFLLNQNDSLVRGFVPTGDRTDAGDEIARLVDATTPGVVKGQIVFTGHMGRVDHQGLRTGKQLEYIFYKKAKEQLEISEAVWCAFEDQLTKPQDGLLSFLRKQGDEIPIFFLARTVDERREVTAIGLARYFRLAAKFGPAKLASRLESGISLPQRIFGRVGELSLAGRVKFTSASCTTQPAPTASPFPPRGGLVAGNPAASAVSLYLEQTPSKVKFARVNEHLATFDDTMKPVLRGRKLYWHRKSPFAPPPPNDNTNVQAQYFPLPVGTRFEFKVVIDRLDELELGALMESLDLPDSSAHKLGLGKAFGLGSVRVHIDLERSTLHATRTRYASLKNRASATSNIAATVTAAKTAFQSAICAASKVQHFEAIPHIADFRRMTEFKNAPEPKRIEYMTLNADRTTPERRDVYRAKPILQSPSSILPKIP